MANSTVRREDLIEIVFENRNRMYGAYQLRRQYPMRLSRSLLAALLIAGGLILFITIISKRPEPLTRKPTPGIVILDQGIPPILAKPVPPAARPPVRKPTSNFIPVVVPEKSNVPVASPDTSVQNWELTTISGEITGVIPGGAVIPGSGDQLDVANTKEEMPPVIYRGEDVDEPAGFPGGNRSLQRFIQRNLKPPVYDVDEPVAMTVQFRFVINKDGEPEKFEWVAGDTADFKLEVMRVLKKMPKWKPARYKGFTVPMYFVLPVTYLIEPD